MNQMSESKKLLILVGSPRRNGNSAILAEAVKRGAEQEGTQINLHFVDDFIEGFLRDCRECRLPNGECSINDRYKSLFMDYFLNCDGVVFCTPVYWYGMSAQMKSFFDRSFCYYSASYKHSDQVIKKMAHKRVGLVLVSEETFPSLSHGIIHQIQEFSRYTHSEFVGVVQGIGNSRGDVLQDPSTPERVSENLGREFFKKHFSDYRLDTDRSSKVWGSDSHNL